jgi:protein-tyrosine phosphatase
MLPLTDIHCHLLAGLDDGPPTQEEALAMCRLAYEDGTRLVAATAHQNEDWPRVTPAVIRLAVRELAQALRDAGIPLTVLPGAEVMVHADVEEAWNRGELLSVGDRGQYLLIELPHGQFLDLAEMVRNFCRAGVRPILAHPERQPELLHEPGQIEHLIRAGCLVQVSARSVTHRRCREDEQALKRWFRRGIVHLLGSDGHDPSRRPPGLAAAYRQIVAWAGDRVADRVAGTNGLAVLQGLPLQVPPPEPRGNRWVGMLWSSIGG